MRVRVCVVVGGHRGMKDTLSPHLPCQDADRLVARTRPLASSVHVLGLPAPPPPAADTAGAEERCADAFDDGEFYQHLLRELLASNSGAGGGASAATPAGVKPYERRVRPNVDRRASKARRMKFVPLPKLVAFAAPAPYVVPPELAVDVDTIVASLFRAVGGSDVQSEKRDELGQPS